MTDLRTEYDGAGWREDEDHSFAIVSPLYICTRGELRLWGLALS